MAMAISKAGLPYGEWVWVGEGGCEIWCIVVLCAVGYPSHVLEDAAVLTLCLVTHRAHAIDY